MRGSITMDYMQPIDFAKHLRQASTSSEQFLWQFLRNRQRCGKKFRRQHLLGIYIADFYCPRQNSTLRLIERRFFDVVCIECLKFSSQDFCGSNLKRLAFIQP